MFKNSSIIAALLISFLMSGCGTYRMPGIETFPKDQLANMHVPATPLFGHSVSVHSIDGKSRGYGLFDVYQLIPGKRIVTVIGNTQSGLYRDPENILFDAEPGKVYELVFDVRKGTQMPPVSG